MKQFILPLTLIVMLLTGCSAPRQLTFANRQWHISPSYGQILDTDTTYRFTFGDVLIPMPLTIISSSDYADIYPGMDRFMADILHTARLDSAEILFYVPAMNKMIVRPLTPLPPLRPSSVTSPLDDEKPYTMITSRRDVEDWVRQPKEMYTYIYYSKKKKQMLIVDHYDYGTTPIAEITILQNDNKATSRMGLTRDYSYPFFRNRDLSHFMDDVEFWAQPLRSHRAISHANYQIGLNPTK